MYVTCTHTKGPSYLQDGKPEKYTETTQQGKIGDSVIIRDAMAHVDNLSLYLIADVLLVPPASSSSVKFTMKKFFD